MSIDTLYIMNIIEDTTVDGPGFRTSVYSAGCTHACKGCHNPSSWDIKHGTATPINNILDTILSNPFADVTFSGGDPMMHGPLYSKHADPRHPGKVSTCFGQLSSGGLTFHKPRGFRRGCGTKLELIPNLQLTEGSGLMGRCCRASEGTSLLLGRSQRPSDAASHKATRNLSQSGNSPTDAPFPKPRAGLGQGIHQDAVLAGPESRGGLYRLISTTSSAP